jgi:hypothetical protein
MSTFGRDRYGFACTLRDILIEHLDGAAVDFRRAEPHSTRRRAIMVLLGRGLIEAEDRARPASTTITEKGRQEMCKLLADWADALLQVGYGDPVDDKSEKIGSFGTTLNEVSLAYVAEQKLEQDARAQPF